MKKTYVKPTADVMEVGLVTLLASSTIKISDQPGTFDVKEEEVTNNDILWDYDWSE